MCGLPAFPVPTNRFGAAVIPWKRVADFQFEINELTPTQLPQKPKRRAPRREAVAKRFSSPPVATRRFAMCRSQLFQKLYLPPFQPLTQLFSSPPFAPNSILTS